MMKNTFITGPKFASELITYPRLHSQNYKEILKSAKNGIFIGNMRFMPFFLSFDFLMNPHVFICGVTGSGKTYLMKNLMLKLSATLGSLIIVIDFTGEYRQFSCSFGGRCVSPSELGDVMNSIENGIVHVDLSGISGKENRIGSADEVLCKITEVMRSSMNRKRRVFVMLDEAWKLLKGSKHLEALIREGRKYMHGLIFSSQLIEDIDLSLLSNAATLFVFRLQNMQSLDRLAKNYVMQDLEVLKIQNLGVGSCVVIQTNALNKRSIAFIEKVSGYEPEMFFKINLGNGMEIEIPRKKFGAAVAEMCSPEYVLTILHTAEESGSIDLSELIRDLIANGTDRRKVLAYLRALGINDDAIADSFARALAVSVKINEKGD